MVIAQAQKGYSVAPVSEDELLDLTTTRVSIEQLCLRRAVEHGDLEWETAIVATFHRLHRIPERDAGDPTLLSETWSQAHAGFHAALVSECRSGWLLRLRGMLYAQTERYRRLSVPLRREERDVDAEHRAMMDAAIARNADHLCGLISDHLWRTTRILLSSPILSAAAAQDTGLSQSFPNVGLQAAPENYTTT